ncbi:MAG: SMC-Scp complex subunit ScpB [Gammaproteobacteria bacterium]|nr:SMC-Scp complex subunit ScpB [Gammaproteobacteria bacterium]
MNNDLLKNIIESALLASGRPLSLGELRDLFAFRKRPERAEIRKAIKALQADYEDRGIELIEVATGFRIQVRPKMTEWLTKLWEERPPRYSRALLETLALIAYRQPITRGDIEDVRGVAVSTNIMRTLLERSWIKVVGHREVPGRPALYATTPQFLEYFSLKKLEDLPPLQDIADIDSVVPQLELEMAEEVGTSLRVVAGSDHDAQEIAADESTDDDPADEIAQAEHEDGSEERHATAVDESTDGDAADEVAQAEYEDGSKDLRATAADESTDDDAADEVAHTQYEDGSEDLDATAAEQDPEEAITEQEAEDTAAVTARTVD